MEGARLSRAAAIALLALAGALAAQSNDPRECPWCGGDPELMARAKLVSHGGFEFGESDTAAVDAQLAPLVIRWIESEHFEIGFALGTYKISPDEKDKLRAELATLKEALPAIDPKPRVLDPWLRAHLFALRAERVWDRFLEIMHVRAEDFPSGRSGWVLGTPYRGEGPYVGQRGKFELLIVPARNDHVTFLREQFGLSTETTQRWNVVSRDSMIAVMHTQEDTLRSDVALHGHVAFVLTHNLENGYEHYSYETPNWIREGLGHFVEREIDPRYNSFHASEGATAQKTRKDDWASEVKKMIAAGDAPRMAELVNLRTFGEFDLEDHYATWSMVTYLVTEHGAGFARLNAELHGMKDGKGFPDGSGLDDKLRNFFLECIGMSYAEFDEAWRAWALAR